MPINYYGGNSLTEYITQINSNYISFDRRSNNWALIYGDNFQVPQLFVFAILKNNLREPIFQADIDIYNTLANQFSLPSFLIIFDEINDFVLISENNMSSFKEIKWSDLKSVFIKYNLNFSGNTSKQINSQPTSRFHDWQRKNLGAIEASDIDMIKLGQGRIQSIIELKRSAIRLDKWKPFKEDFANFALLINTIVKSGGDIQFKLFYNYSLPNNSEQANGRTDDISKVKVYEFSIPTQEITVNQVGALYHYIDTFSLISLPL